MSHLLALALLLFALAPCTAPQSPRLYSSDGKNTFLGNLNANPYFPNTTANPHGPYGSRYSPDSARNPYGRGASRPEPPSRSTRNFCQAGVISGPFAACPSFVTT